MIATHVINLKYITPCCGKNPVKHHHCVRDNHITLLGEKVLYRFLKGSISATYLEPLKGSIHSLKKGFLWVLYRTLGFHTLLPKKWFYIEPFWSSIYEEGDGTISGSK